MDNGQTNERLVVKTFASPPGEKHVLVARYPVGANQEWIKANEQEIMECKFYDQNRQIHFERSLRNGLLDIWYLLIQINLIIFYN
jgi:hypothetical protein